jgi:hypothetical protein
MCLGYIFVVYSRIIYKSKGNLARVGGKDTLLKVILKDSSWDEDKYIRTEMIKDSKAFENPNC